MAEGDSGDQPLTKVEAGDKVPAKTSAKRSTLAVLTQPGAKTVQGLALIGIGLVMIGLGLPQNMVGIIVGAGVTLIVKDQATPPPKS